MFFFGKKNTPADLSWIRTDIHSHLIPGIDDGSPDLDTSLQLIKGMIALGYKKLITTPHVLWEMYPNTSEKIKSGLEALRTAAAAENLDVELEAAAEYFIDDHFHNQLVNKAPLLPLSGNLVLVEFSMIMAPMELQTVFFEMQMQNYQPLIAHPERYIYLIRRKEFYEELKSAGCQFQLNLLSLTGGYGATVQELAEHLLKKGFYDYVGTDLHNVRHLEALQKLPAATLKKLQDSGAIKNDKL